MIFASLKFLSQCSLPRPPYLQALFRKIAAALPGMESLNTTKAEAGFPCLCLIGSQICSRLWEAPSSKVKHWRDQELVDVTLVPTASAPSAATSCSC